MGKNGLLLLNSLSPVFVVIFREASLMRLLAQHAKEHGSDGTGNQAEVLLATEEAEKQERIEQEIRAVIEVRSQPSLWCYGSLE